MQAIQSVYRGRFAPSPTGPLHLGSLVAAVGSYLDAKCNGGEWLVRMEDLDRPREVPGAADAILRTLEALGLEWDGEVVYQTQRLTFYQQALEDLIKRNLIYPCRCSRKEIADSSIVGIYGPVYPGTCSHNVISLGEIHDHNHSRALRVRTPPDCIIFEDILGGQYRQNLKQEIGDFVLRRADGIYTYQLAVVVDDALQGVTHVVRGVDLLDSTPRQIFLQQLLGYATPCYMHLPVVTNIAGEKLSKQTRAAAIESSDGLAHLIQAIQFLGQNPPQELTQGDIASFWQWAKENWCAAKIPHDSNTKIYDCVS
ncbi:MAG: tRNA glutamyl-Q(34) synthetase GluQRS [Nitrosomonas sp.]